MIHQAPTFSVLATLGLVLATGIGCAGLSSGERTLLVSGVAYDLTEPGAEFDSIEEAAVAALTYTRATATRAQTEQLRAGSIVRLGDRYSWVPAEQSGHGARSGSRSSVRLAITEAHVATYIVQPRTGENRIDRLNEGFTPRQRRFVDEADPLHRPMFLLTPSGRIVSYSKEEAVSEVADLRTGRVDETNEQLSYGEGAVSAPGTELGLVARSR